MDRTYDIFEIHPDRTPIWKGAVTGHEEVVRKLHELSGKIRNELRMMHVPTQTLIAVVNPPKS